MTPHTPIHHVIKQRIANGDTLCIATPILAELLFGILQLPRARLNLQEWQQHHNGFIYYDVDRIIAEQSADLRLELRKRGWQLHIIDAMIAVIALRYDLILATTDQDFVKVRGLKIENWLNT